jgi:Bifunctional DNA primase/polymerase, N-terminal
MTGPAATGELARVCPGDLLAALGELGCGPAAEAYAALGYPVVPIHTVRPGGGCTCADPACSDPGKHPRLAGWTRLASTDSAMVRRWWRRWPTANLALATGRRFDVLDLDSTQGVEALRAVLSIAPLEHPGPVARTGGGWHLLYAPTGYGNRVRLLPGVDWRGRSGLVVAPPSRHTSGGRYAWLRPLTATLPEVPTGLRRLLAPPRPAPSPPRTPVRRRVGYGAAALAGEAAKVRACAPDSGRRQWTLNIAAFKLGQLVAVGLLSEAEVWAELAAAAAASGLGEREITKTIRRGLADGHAKPTHRRGGRR